MRTSHIPACQRANEDTWCRGFSMEADAAQEEWTISHLEWAWNVPQVLFGETKRFLLFLCIIREDLFLFCFDGHCAAEQTVCKNAQERSGAFCYALWQLETSRNTNEGVRLYACVWICFLRGCTSMWIHVHLHIAYTFRAKLPTCPHAWVFFPDWPIFACKTSKLVRLRLFHGCCCSG